MFNSCFERIGTLCFGKLVLFLTFVHSKKLHKHACVHVFATPYKTRFSFNVIKHDHIA